jgi:hypothetical protein
MTLPQKSQAVVPLILAHALQLAVYTSQFVAGLYFAIVL